MGSLSASKRRWHQSLYVKVLAVALALGTVGVGTAAFFIAQRVSTQIYEAKRDAVFADVDRSTTEFQQRLAGMEVSSGTRIELFLQDAVQQFVRTGDGPRRAALLLRSASNDSELRVPNLVGSSGTLGEEDLLALDAATLRERASASTGTYWQAVSVASSDGDVPAIAVARQVAVPIAGTFDLIVVYDLRSEQQTFNAVQRTMAIGSLALIALVGMVAWVVTRMVVRPVQSAAKAATRLADGHLDERLPVLSQDDLGSLALSFNEMAAKLQDQIEQMGELSRLQRRFVSDVSHELRTPLTTIRMAADVISGYSDDFDEAPRRSTQLMSDQIERFERLLADLLEISRFDAGAAQLDVDQVDIREIVQSVMAMVAPLAEAEQLTVRWADDSEAPVNVQADRLRVERIVRNLLVNAIEHAEHKDVDVTVAASDISVSLLVRDYGVGMNSRDVRRVFNRFWRADPARARTTGGTGLGLSISLEDARLHGGFLEAWGSPGEGSAFRLTLPRTPGAALDSSPIPLPDRGKAVWSEDPEIVGGAATLADHTNAADHTP